MKGGEKGKKRGMAWSLMLWVCTVECQWIITPTSATCSLKKLKSLKHSTPSSAIKTNHAIARRRALKALNTPPSPIKPTKSYELPKNINANLMFRSLLSLSLLNNSSKQPLLPFLPLLTSPPSSPSLYADFFARTWQFCFSITYYPCNIRTICRFIRTYYNNLRWYSCRKWMDPCIPDKNYNNKT